jgi:acyl carrier protein
MEKQNFVRNIAEQFEDSDPATFTTETRFRDVEGWSSLIALSIIAMVDEEYNVSIKGDDVRNSQTIEDLFTIVKSRL